MESRDWLPMASISSFLILPWLPLSAAFDGEMADGQIHVSGVESALVGGNQKPAVVGNRVSPAAVDDCSVLLAMRTAGEPIIIDCVGIEAMDPAFNVSLSKYFLMYPTGGGSDRGTRPVAVTTSEFRSLPIDGGSLDMQPAATQVLVNIETIAWSTAQAQVLETTILGTPVSVRATPVEWAWDFGAGTEPFVTSAPGGPYPNLDVTQIYRRTAAGQSIGLTITWTGEYQVNGTGPWLPIAGSTTTSARSRAFDVVEAPARLVTGPLTATS